MIPDFIIVKANVYLRKPEEGGRTTGIKVGYRPDHVFELPNDIHQIRAYIGDIQFDENELFLPDETKLVTVRFLRNLEIEKYMKVGQKWWIYEVPRLLADGEIVEI